MADELNWAIKNTREELAHLIEEAGASLESRPVSIEVVYKVNLILEEILTNIVKYAFSDGNVHIINVHLAVKDTAVLIEFVDDGKEFDPFAYKLPQLGESILEREEGGLGIHLVRQAANFMEYRRDRGNNLLTIGVDL